MRLISRAATALILVAFIAGPPVAAGLWLAQHRPPQLSLTALKQWLQQPRQPADLVIVGLLIAAGLWLLLIYYLARHVVPSQMRGWRKVTQLPLPSPAQVTAGSLAGVAALTMPAATTQAATTPTSVAAAPPPADPDTSGQPAPKSIEQPEAAGIALPGGGWIPYPIALAVTALIALTWTHRRREYQPDPHRIGTHHQDRDLRTPPPTANTIATAFADQPPTKPAAVDALVLARLPAGILHLDGPGAHSAARGLLVAAALSTAIHPADRPAVTIRPDDWKHLLPGLKPTGSLATFIHSTEPLARQQPGEGPAAPTLLALDSTTLAATHWYVNTDGTTTSSDRRLCVLDHNAAIDLLTLVQHHNNTDSQGLPVPAPAASRQHVATPQTSPLAKLILIGSCALTLDGQPVHLSRSASLQILAYLAVHPEGASRNTLISAIWPHLPPASVTQRLHTTLSDLRRRLRPTTGDPVNRLGDIYQLNPDAIDADLGEWRTTTAVAATAISHTTRSDACRRIVQLYRGEIAPGQQWPWIAPTREAARRDALDACLHLARKDPKQAITWLQRAAVIDPYNAKIQQQIAGHAI
ncbi:hypothetical protein [Actinoplanes sp. NBRC 103695]|uniref:AfsR/SARP family transcriptional regulator n=1 Tax=Actinoplanes sp. NBRC 103695 TaxID=3032202 RepID=UPI0024A22C80|nr:hypothetical protein [Actinoplanes sp. NBRC 103695]GLY96538.1 hypothetical protein Acsp02_37930 [Actinoplanes sp. NBRC 103695]